MIKNIIIVCLFFLLASLLFQNKNNVDILVDDLVMTKEKIVDGAEYVKETFDEKFATKEFEVEIDIPSMQLQKEPFSEGSGIREETFLNEEKK